MRPRKPILVVTARGELRYMLRNCTAHVEVFSAESREELKALAQTGQEILLAIVDIRDMQSKGAVVFVAKVRESFPLVKILLIAKRGDPRLFGADLALRECPELSMAIVDAVIGLAVYKHGPKPKRVAMALPAPEIPAAETVA